MLNAVYEVLGSVLLQVDEPLATRSIGAVRVLNKRRTLAPSLPVDMVVHRNLPAWYLPA
jgi:hypothetical protein